MSGLSPSVDSSTPPRDQRRRVSVCYEGRVQGVGFRYTVRQIAESCAVAGIVRNEPDGTVFLSAEGTESELRRFLELIRQSHVGGYIVAEYPQWGNATGTWTDFRVTF